MAWESRKPDGSKYFYLSRRDDDGRVRKIYLGTGCGAKRLAEMVAQAKARRAAELDQVSAARARVQAVDRLMRELEALGGVLFEAFLLSEGFHRPNYGVWRRRRGHGRHQSTEPRTDC